MSALEVCLSLALPLSLVVGAWLGKRATKLRAARGTQCKHTWDRWVNLEKGLKKGDVHVQGQERECFGCGVRQIRTLGEAA